MSLCLLCLYSTWLLAFSDIYMDTLKHFNAFNFFVNLLVSVDGCLWKIYDPGLGSKTWKLQVINPAVCVCVVAVCVCGVTVCRWCCSVCVCGVRLCMWCCSVSAVCQRCVYSVGLWFSVCLLPLLRLLTPDATHLDGYKRKRKKCLAKCCVFLLFCSPSCVVWNLTALVKVSSLQQSSRRWCRSTCRPTASPPTSQSVQKGRAGLEVGPKVSPLADGAPLLSLQSTPGLPEQVDLK